jgi:uncharacterized protein
MSFLRRLALALVIIGALNWGLIGLFDFDLVATIFGGEDALLSRIVYTLVGLSGLYCLTMLFEPTREENAERNAVPPRNLQYSTEFAEDDAYDEFTRNDNDER